MSAIGQPKANRPDQNDSLQKVPSKLSSDGIDRNVLEKVASAAHIENFDNFVDKAAESNAREVNQTFFEAAKIHYKAMFWSMLFSTAIVMEGFDLVMINSFYGQPAFQRKYGDLKPDGTYAISSAWQTGLSNGVQVGSIMGLMINGWACDKYGYRKTIGLSLVCIICFIFITFFAPSIEVLLVGEILCGFPWGVFQTLTTAYASEVCPVILRPYLTTYVNLCWVMGQLISSGVLKALVTRNDQWAYRIPFALQWFWPIPILVGVLFAPESPWWFIRQNRLEDAKGSLRKLASRAETDEDHEQTIAKMVHTNELEKAVSSGTTYMDCFRGFDLRRTEIVCMVWMIQLLSGSGFTGYSTIFFLEAGLSTGDAFSMNLGVYAFGAVGTMASWWLMNHVGRRKIYLWGIFSMGVILLAVGATGFSGGSTSASWAAGAMVLVYTFMYDFTVGPVAYCLVAELSSTRLRAKTTVLARNAYNIVGIINNILFPRQLNPGTNGGWGWGRKAGFFWAGSNALCFLWSYFRLPEPKGRTYAELDILFEQGVSAREFSKTKVDLYAHGRAPVHDDMLMEKPGGGH